MEKVEHGHKIQKSNDLLTPCYPFVNYFLPGLFHDWLLNYQHCSSKTVFMYFMDQQFYLKLVKLVTHRSLESNGDELYIKYEGRRIWPEHVKFFDVDIKNIDVPVETDVRLSKFGWVILELWEYDNWLSSSKLGTFRCLLMKTQTSMNYMSGPAIIRTNRCVFLMNS